jgi:hypothetical protein
MKCRLCSRALSLSPQQPCHLAQRSR